jgi:pimeloyl-ACP methyl ester carboxylesterase
LAVKLDDSYRSSQPHLCFHLSVQVHSMPEVAPLIGRQWQIADGLTLAGETCGKADAPAVVLLHGGGQTRRSWTRAMRNLAAAGYFSLAFDMRGHGDSDWAPDGDYSVGALAGDLMRVLADVPQPRAIIGASLGGLASFYAIATADEPLATALVLVDVVLRPAQSGSDRIRTFMNAHRHGFATLEEAAEAVNAFDPARRRPANPERLRANLRQRPDGRFYWHWDPQVPEHQTPARADLLISVAPRMTVPTLLVRGEHSEFVDAAGVADMRRHVPQLEVLELAGAGHMITGDHNDAFLSGVGDFLARHLI